MNINYSLKLSSKTTRTQTSVFFRWRKKFSSICPFEQTYNIYCEMVILRQDLMFVYFWFQIYNIISRCFAVQWVNNFGFFNLQRSHTAKLSEQDFLVLLMCEDDYQVDLSPNEATEHSNGNGWSFYPFQFS